MQKKKIKAYFFIYSAPILGEANNMEVFRYFRTVAYNNLNDFYESFFKKLLNLMVKNTKKKKIFKEKNTCLPSHFIHLMIGGLGF